MFTFLDAITLSDDGRHDEGLALLRDFYRVHLGEDSEDWLRNAVLSGEALILRNKGDYTGAVEAYRQAKWPPENPLAYLVNAHGLALVLAAMDRHAEAIAALESGLGGARSGALENYVPLLLMYMEMIGKRELPLRYRDLVERMAAHWNISASTESLNDPVGLASIVREIGVRMEQNRYS